MIRNEFSGLPSGGSISSSLHEEDGSYVFLLELELKPTPIHGMGVVLNPVHLRKSEALWYTQLMLFALTEEVDQHGVFTRLDCVSDINGVIVNVSIPLPLVDPSPLRHPMQATIELHDPFDGNIYTWPETGETRDAGPDHWCFKGTNGCEACEENSVLYSPYEDE